MSRKRPTTQTVTVIKGVPHILASDGEYYEVVDSVDPCEATLSRSSLRIGVQRGVANDPAHCHYATALCAERTLGIIEARVRKNATYLRFASQSDVWVKFWNPTSVREFIQEFDDAKGKAIHLGDSFTLRLLELPPSVRRGYRAGKTGGTSRKPKSHYERRSFR